MSQPKTIRHPFSDASLRVNQVPLPLIKDFPTIHHKTITPLRLGSLSDPQDVYDYDYEVWQFQLSIETDQIADSQYFSHQQWITPEIRMNLIDWLQSFHDEEQLQTETLFLAVRLIDLYLSRTTIEVSHLQLLGSAAISLSAKAEEIQIVTANRILHYSGDCFTREELVEMETELFTTVDFVVTRPTVCDFLTRYLDLLGLRKTAFFMAYYIAECTLLLSTVIGIKPSVLAAAIVCLARSLTNELPGWPTMIENYTNIRFQEIHGICKTIHEGIQQLRRNNQGGTVHRRFAEEGRGGITNVPILEKVKFF
jgi:cyclin B